MGRLVERDIGKVGEKKTREAGLAKERAEGSREFLEV